MFGKSPEAKFNRCEHKAIRQHIALSTLVGVELVCPKVKDANLKIMDLAEAHATKRGIIPYTERKPNGANFHGYRDLAVASKYLAKSAGTMACASCEYADMTAVEVSIRRAEIAEDRRTIAQNEQRRLEAELATRQADAEIDHLDKQVRGVLPLPSQPEIN